MRIYSLHALDLPCQTLVLQSHLEVIIVRTPHVRVHRGVVVRGRLREGRRVGSRLLLTIQTESPRRIREHTMDELGYIVAGSWECKPWPRSVSEKGPPRPLTLGWASEPIPG
jgi:hypothetical protein